MTAFEDWLDARDGDSIARTWTALAAERPLERVTLREPGWWLTTQGIARFAAAFLGWPVERLEWITRGLIEHMPSPVFDARRETARSFLEECLDDDSGCEIISFHEERDGTRGIQLVSALSSQSLDDDYMLNHTTYGGVVYRVFDRATATGVSITSTMDVAKVAKIGDVDLDALDLFGREQGFDLTTWTGADPDDVRALVAQLASEVDAHFDVSTTWPARAIQGATRHEAGTSALETRRLDTTVFVDVHGLPWGYQIDTHVGAYHGSVGGAVSMRLPLPVGRAVISRLAGIPGAILR